MQNFPLVVYLQGATAAILQLQGPGSQVEFRQSKAAITASCLSEAASISYVTPRQLGPADFSGNVTIELNNVPPSCINMGPVTPCVPHNDAMPSLFHCVFTGDSANVSSGPFKPYTVLIERHGVTLGIATELTCPLPSVEVRRTAATLGIEIRIALALSHQRACTLLHPCLAGAHSCDRLQRGRHASICTAYAAIWKRPERHTHPARRRRTDERDPAEWPPSATFASAASVGAPPFAATAPPFVTTSGTPETVHAQRQCGGGDVRHGLHKLGHLL